LIYAVYVVGNVVALLSFGQISDQAGRKRATIPGLGLASASALLFLFAQSTVWLFASRLLIGLAVGILSVTGAAWLAEYFGPTGRSNATVTATTANLVGVAIGPLLGGLLAQYAPAPLELPFVAYLLVLAMVAAAIGRTPESEVRSIDKMSQLRVRPRIGVPRDKLGSFIAPAVAAFVTFALGGLYFALIPAILIKDLHERNVGVAGLVVFELGVVAALLILLSRTLRPVVAMTNGLVVLLTAGTLVVAAQAAHSMGLLLLATVLAGATVALGYRSSLEVVNEIAPADCRAEVVSSYFIAGFVGNSLPVIGVGVVSTLTDPLIASLAIACTVGILSLAALGWQHRGAGMLKTKKGP
jgi:MFS family permease